VDSVWRHAGLARAKTLWDSLRNRTWQL